MSGTIAVLDQGKTNIKLSVATAGGSVIDAVSIPNPTRPGPPWRHHDIREINAWVLDTLAKLARRYPLERFIATGHGASGVLVSGDPDIDGDGTALPMIDYEQEPSPEIAERYTALAGSFAHRGSAIMMGTTHQARQLLMMEAERPDDFAAARWMLGLPQYWAWRMTGNAFSEWSVLGAQSHLYDFAGKRWSAMVRRQGWERLMPPVADAWRDAGPIRPDLAARHRLPPELRIHVGVHDSSANFYRYLAAGLSDFTLVSTGTWIVAMADGVPADRLDEARGMTGFRDVYGRPCGGALVMGGREFDHVRPDTESRATTGAVAAIVKKGIFALPAFGPDAGQFPGSVGRGRFMGEGPSGQAEKQALALLYAALLAAECATSLGEDRPVVLDGAFAGNPVFCALFAGFVPVPVSVSLETDGVAGGAALLCSRGAGRQTAADAGLIPVVPLPVEGLVGYREAWRRHALHNASGKAGDDGR